MAAAISAILSTTQAGEGREVEGKTGLLPLFKEIAQKPHPTIFTGMART